MTAVGVSNRVRAAGAALLVLSLAAPAAAAELLDGGARRLGTKITYEVSDSGVDFRMVAAVLATSPGVQFEWYTTSPAAAVGIREVPAAALAGSRAHCECYRDEEWGVQGDETALWVSAAVLADLHGAGTAQFAFNERGGTVLPAPLTFQRLEGFETEVDGEAGVLPAVVATTPGGTTLWIHDDPADPLLLGVEGAWSLRVTSIRQRPDGKVGAFATVGGRRLHYVRIGSGPPVFVLHGGPGMEHYYFRPQLDALAEDWSVVYIDQPGHGLSERFPPSEPYTIAGAVAAVDGLRHALAYEKIALLGHSYGGFVSQLYALAHGRHLSALVLVDTAPSWEWNLEASRNIARHGDDLQRNLPRGLSDDERIRIQFPIYFDPPDRAASEAFMDRAILSYRPWRELAASQAFRTYDVRPRLGEIGVPTLVLVGEGDLITTPNQAAILHSGIAGARLLVFPETGHNPFLEEEAAFLSAVAGFLREATGVP